MLPWYKRTYYWLRFRVLDWRHDPFPFIKGDTVEECEHCEGWGVVPHRHDDDATIHADG